jgi:hypothetical protein
MNTCKRLCSKLPHATLEASQDLSKHAASEVFRTQAASSDERDHINKFIGQILAQNLLPCDGRQVASVIRKLMEMAR